MILTGGAIDECVKKGDVIIEPYSPENLNPNSYNFHLGDYVLVYRNMILDPKLPQPVERVDIPDEGLVLYPDRIYLGYIRERMGSEKYVPIINGRSSTGRLGLFVHITANLIDIGSINNWTLQMHAVQPVRVYRGMSIGQVTFWRTYGDIKLYDGKYKDSSGPVESQIWKDFQQYSNDKK